MEGKSVYRILEKDFKLNAVKLVLEGTRLMNKIAEEPGIRANTPGNRKQDYLKDKDDSFPEKGYRKPDDAELIKLRNNFFVLHRREIY